MMTSTVRRTGVWLAAALLAAGWGCGDGTPSVSSSTTEATVTGKVTLYGKTADEGEIVFNPANVHRKDAARRSAPIGKDGTYTVTTLVGENQVNIQGANLMKQHPKLAYEGMSFDVQRGQNTLNVDFPLSESSP
ncbi:MAG: hypothetical protein LC745_00935 [Planctomycetia bacterium]|nr:hypothetical protein [Planctomycetia bacterium]